MSRVIKNNDGVAVVEGTPAASLVKDVDKFFASKPPERMAGESISQPKKINKNKIMSEAEYKADATRRINEEMKRGRAISPMPYSMYVERQQPGFKEKQAAAIGKKRELLERYNRGETSLGRSQEVDSTPRRNEARDKAESRRERFFERRRSRKEAERSQREQSATQGRFITTLET